ncbi:MAG: alpha-L-fucosidase [Lentisphaeria bacterium]
MSVNTAIQHFYQHRFGIFFHWGVYAVIGGHWKGKTTPYIGEWAQSYFRIPKKEYETIARTFNPQDFNADEWIRKIADAGAKYIVFTAKHHDGFAMYHSAVDSYNITDMTPFHRDPLKELSEACAKYHVGLGIYYSQNLDWHDVDARDPGPNFPTNVGEMPWGNNWDFQDFKKKDFARFLQNKCIPQIRELLLNYGPICEFWFDCPLAMTKEESKMLYNFVHSLQPDCAVNSRVGNGYGDFGSLGDNQNMHGKSSKPVESPITLNDTWGFKIDDHHWKSAQYITEQLAMLADHNANMLLNIGPMKNGKFPEETDKILSELATWHKQNPDAIVGTTANPFPAAFPWGFCTQSGKRLYFFLKEFRPQLKIPGISEKIVKSSCPFEQSKDLTLFPDATKTKKSLLPIIMIEFAKKPKIEPTLFLTESGMELTPCSAQMTHGKTETYYNKKIQLSAAAEIEKISAHIKLEQDGTASSWHNSSDLLTWPIHVRTTGRYRVDLITCQATYNAPWTGERTIEIRWQPENIALLCELKKTKTLFSPCYAAGETTIGELDLKYTGEHFLSCHTTTITQNQHALSMNLRKIKLTYLKPLDKKDCQKPHKKNL